MNIGRVIKFFYMCILYKVNRKTLECFEVLTLIAHILFITLERNAVFFQHTLDSVFTA